MQSCAFGLRPFGQPAESCFLISGDRVTTSPEGMAELQSFCGNDAIHMTVFATAAVRGFLESVRQVGQQHEES